MSSGDRIRNNWPQLSPQDAAAGAGAALRNAVELFEDGMLLYDAKRYARAAALFILAIEEAGKPVILADIAASDTEEMRKTHWRRLTYHEAKVSSTATLDLLLRMREAPGGPMPTAETLKNAPSVFNRFKQSAFYSEDDGHGGWTVPGDRVMDYHATHLAELAQTAISSAKRSPLQRAEGMALWVKHFNPSLGRGTPEGMRVFRTFRAQAIAAGLCSENWSRLLDSLPE